MSTKTKITLIIGGIIMLISGWVIFVVSLLGDNPQQTNILQNQSPQNTAKKTETSQNNKRTQTTQNNNITNTHNTSNTDNTSNLNKKNEKNTTNNPYPNLKGVTFKMLVPKNLLRDVDWKYFQIIFKKSTQGIIQYNFYTNEKEFDKELTYKLATKDDSFDFAIVPAYWFNHLNKLANISFKISGDFPIVSIFDYNFSSFLDNNHIKAIPFAIDPIIGYAYSKNKLLPIQTFDSWKNLIIKSPNRFTSSGKLKTMPLFLGYDSDYLDYLTKHKYSIFPVFDFILHYYVFEKSEKGVNLIKDFGKDPVYKTFSFKLFLFYNKKLSKYDFCKGFEKYCLLFYRKTNLVYGTASDENYFQKNRLNIFKKFRFKTTNIQKVSVPLANFQADYPAKGWIIIINPNSKNLKKLGEFIKAYIILGEKNKLPFYKNMISPFVKNQNVPENLQFLKAYLGRFRILYNMNLNYPKTITKKEINFLKDNIRLPY